jgi:mevalonate kinase
MDFSSAKTYRAVGKLMLFGEYLVLKGSKCLAFPLKYGQTLTVHSTESSTIEWGSYELDQLWFSATFDLSLNIMQTSDEEKAKTLVQLFRYIQEKNPHMLTSGMSFSLQSDFNFLWGFGSSSTLISVLSQWSQLDPYDLLENSFGGSGYDIACAREKNPLVYSISNRLEKTIELSEAITANFLFIYSGEKQNSRNEIRRFEQREVTDADVNEMNTLIDTALNSATIHDFEKELIKSEELLSPILGRATLKERNFADYPFAIKSLGAWGGDFFLATFRDEKIAREYFKNKGYTVQFTYNELREKE